MTNEERKDKQPKNHKTNEEPIHKCMQATAENTEESKKQEEQLN